ncbi:MAG TPA: aspartate-semialdehyde dehydrogenase [Candidatus Acidoferrales bacterium]|nr:aspartate-semialdehyde dehydrogenase [Candidatus Acidoferrales bacterium]
MSAPSRRFNVAVVGATGMVGQEMLRVLAQRRFPVGRVKALASERSAGREFPFNGARLQIEALDESSFEDVDLALFSAGADIALALAPVAVEAGALVVDNSSAWRMKENVPLVVPEVNPDDVRESEGIIAVANCCAIPLAVVLNPIKQAAGLERVLVSTYQSASGAGRSLVEELEAQTKAIAEAEPPAVAVYPHQLAYNVVPGGWKPVAEGYNEEEVKIATETRKILHQPGLRIAATCVRVPVPIGHAESVFLETKAKLDAAACRDLLARSPGILVEDDPDAQIYPTPANVAGKDEVYVGRIRNDLSASRGLALWVVSDNLRKGAALNAVQIAELALEMGVI